MRYVMGKASKISISIHKAGKWLVIRIQDMERDARKFIQDLD